MEERETAVPIKKSVRQTITTSLVQKPTRLHTEGFGQLVDDGDCRVAGAAFEIADIGSVDFGLEGEFFLRQVSFCPEATQVFSKALTNIHTSEVARM